MNQFNKLQIEAIKLLYEAAKTFIPVVTGYLILFSGSISYLWKDERHVLTDSLIRIAGATIILGVASLGVWSGVVPYCIRTFKKRRFSVIFLWLILRSNRPCFVLLICRFRLFFTGEFRYAKKD